MRFSLPLRLLAALAALPPLLSLPQNDEETSERPSPGLPQLVDQWRDRHGQAWRYHVDWQTGHLDMLYGGSALPAFQPHGEADWERLALRFLDETGEMHGVATASLEHDRSVFLPLGQAGSTDKLTVRFRQVVGAVPVAGGQVNVLLDASSGALLSIQSTAMPRLHGAPTVPSFTTSSATAAAERLFEERVGVLPTAVGAPELVFVQVVEAGLRRALLAWQLDLRWEAPGTLPEVWRYWIDAKSGELLRSESRVHHLDVGGTVRSNTTTTTLPDTGGNPEQQVAMPYMDVSSSAGTVTTDAAGNFNFPGVSGPLSCTFTYEGDFARVTNDAGGDYSLSTSLGGTGNAVLMNPSSTATVTAQSNAFNEIAALRDWIRSVIPGDSTADFQALANCNLNSTCNAYYDGTSVNFFAAGGGCVNTSYTTVVAHEMGHWLNVLYGTGNGSDGIGEGNADVFAMYLYDEPIVGEDFCGNGCHIRTGLNATQFCGDCCPGCHGGVHADGEVWMGAAWKVRRNLNTTHGNSAGDAIADLIFLSWMNAYDQTQIRSVMEDQWLTLDDDDGNIGNGTPNYGDIDSAFREQGFPGVDLDAIVISNVTQLPDTQDEAGPYVVQATITALMSPPLAGATLYWRVNGGSFVSQTMAPLTSELHEGAILGQQSPAVVEYYVEATDNAGVDETWPPDAPAELAEFKVGVLTVFLFNEFEGGTNEGWSEGAPGDDATTGTWERGDPDSTSAQPGDDHTPAPGVLCWFTGATGGGGLGGNDVDGGRTTLLSPVFDAGSLNDPEISYWRWYSNDQGSGPNADVFEVDISNDGGGSWSNVETVGPTGPGTSGGWIQHSFRIADIVAPTADMQLRFVASDEGSGSIVEAAVDDIEGVDLGPVTFTDCNGNGVPDEEDISEGTSQDCNGNSVPDECDLSSGTSADCNANSIPDECDISGGTSSDCNSNGTPDECEQDCNLNGSPDDCDISGGTSQDCNANSVPDECDILDGTSLDCNANGTPDECETDCNGNGVPDDCDLSSGTSADCNANSIPDECDIAGGTSSDCNANGTPDECETDCNGNGVPDDCDLSSGTSADCNANSIPDECDIAGGTSSDCNANGTPDECETDCNGNGVPDDCDLSSGTSADCNANSIPDECDIAGGTSSDCNANGTPDECETDCNGNGVPDDCDLSSGTSADCNANSIPDECDIAGGTSSDCNANGTPDECETDCNGNGVPDDCDLSSGTSADCNANSIPDECDIAGGTSSDLNGNGIPDECEVDCNGNGVPDDQDISNGTSMDCNANSIPDECDIAGGTSGDCNANGTPDECETDCNSNGVPDDCDLSSGTSADCNANSIPDECDIAGGTSSDCNANGTPDECETDCNGNGVPDDCDLSNGTSTDCNANSIPDECDIAGGTSSDCNANGTPDECETDCNGNGVPDDCDLSSGTSADCNANSIPDECDIAGGTSSDCNANGTPDECETDCNGNGVPDDCDLSSGTSADCNANSIPDECDIAGGTSSDCNANGTPDECETDCNGNGVPDDCDLSSGTSADCNANSIPDECDIAGGTSSDCNANGTPDECETDCNGNGVPDDCDLSSGTSADCNANSIPDECDIAGGTSDDLNGNGVPDECECSIATYCVAAPNSVGLGALMGWSGSASVAQNDLVLEVDGLPLNQFGIFYYGPNQIQIPFGNGFRCVGGGVYRLPVISTGPQGQTSWALDITDPPLPGGQISSGDTWNFQFWYRDPAAGGLNFNFSDALSILFCE